jgi:hypothetical protein
LKTLDTKRTVEGNMYESRANTPIEKDMRAGSVLAENIADTKETELLPQFSPHERGMSGDERKSEKTEDIFASSESEGSGAVAIIASRLDYALRSTATSTESASSRSLPPLRRKETKLM